MQTDQIRQIKTTEQVHRPNLTDQTQTDQTNRANYQRKQDRPNLTEETQTTTEQITIGNMESLSEPFEDMKS